MSSNSHPRTSLIIQEWLCGADVYKDLTKAHMLPLVAMCVLIENVPTLAAPSPQHIMGLLKRIGQLSTCGFFWLSPPGVHIDTLLYLPPRQRQRSWRDTPWCTAQSRQDVAAIFATCQSQGHFIVCSPGCRSGGRARREYPYLLRTESET